MGARTWAGLGGCIFNPPGKQSRGLALDAAVTWMGRVESRRPFDVRAGGRTRNSDQRSAEGGKRPSAGPQPGRIGRGAGAMGSRLGEQWLEQRAWGSQASRLPGQEQGCVTGKRRWALKMNCSVPAALVHWGRRGGGRHRGCCLLLTPGLSTPRPRGLGFGEHADWFFLFRLSWLQKSTLLSSCFP